MMTQRSDDDSGVRSALWAIALSGLVLTLVAPFLLGADAVLGVALGALLATLNLWALGRVVRALMNGAGLPWVLLGGAKLLALLALVVVLLKLQIASLLPLALGYAALPLGIVLSQLSSARTARRLTSPALDGDLENDARPKG